MLKIIVPKSWLGTIIFFKTIILIVNIYINNKEEITLFGFGKKDKEIAEKQYEELLDSVGEKNRKKEGFVLGQQKDIYDSKFSLDDIISQNDK